MRHSLPLFSFIVIIVQQLFRIKTVDFSGIRTWIVKVEGEHADRVASTMVRKVPTVIEDLIGTND